MFRWFWNPVEQAFEPADCELCAKDLRVDGSKLCSACLEMIKRLEDWMLGEFRTSTQDATPSHLLPPGRAVDRTEESAEAVSVRGFRIPLGELVRPREPIYSHEKTP